MFSNLDSYLVCDSVDGESSFNIIDKTEVFASFINLDDIHESRREAGISSGFTIDLDQPLLHNC